MKKHIVKYKAIMRILVILPVVLTAGFRGFDVGADTRNVWISCVRVYRMSFLDAVTRDLTGILYSALEWIVLKLTKCNIQIFLCVLAGITVYLIVLTIEKWNIKYGGLALFIFYFCLGPNLLNQSRQMVSVAILLYAYYYAFNKNAKKYSLLCLIAGLFHLSSIPIAIIIWFLNNNKIKNHNIFIYTIIFISTFGLDYIVKIFKIIFKNTKYSMYFNSISNIPIGLGVLLVMIPTVIVAFLIQRSMDDKKKMRNTIYMTLPIRMLGYKMYYLYRLYYYFSSINIIAFPYALERMSKKNKQFYRIVIIVACLIYFFFYYCWQGAEIYLPYIPFWKNNKIIY